MPPRGDRQLDARPARRSGRALGRPSQTRRERDLGAGGGPAGRGVLLSSSDSDPDLESVDCLRCRGCRRRFASVASLRLHINHKTLRNTKCASQARKNPRILVNTWRRSRDGQATGIVDGLEADQDSEQDELAGSMAAAGNNMDLPVDADLDLHQVKGLRVCPVCNKCALSVKSASWVWPVWVGQKKCCLPKLCT